MAAGAAATTATSFQLTVCSEKQRRCFHLLCILTPRQRYSLSSLAWQRHRFRSFGILYWRGGLSTLQTIHLLVLILMFTTAHSIWVYPWRERKREKASPPWRIVMLTVSCRTHIARPSAAALGNMLHSSGTAHHWLMATCATCGCTGKWVRELALTEEGMCMWMDIPPLGGQACSRSFIFMFTHICVCVQFGCSGAV